MIRVSRLRGQCEHQLGDDHQHLGFGLGIVGRRRPTQRFQVADVSRNGLTIVKVKLAGSVGTVLYLLLTGSGWASTLIESTRKVTHAGKDCVRSGRRQSGGGIVRSTATTAVWSAMP
jgi:hypothetical protein